MPVWTREQKMAIDARNHTILVSAAAGSGKTAVLVERIVQLVREGYRLNRMLIVTFTRAAAGEMRQRLSQRLLKELHDGQACFSQALDDLESTDISTIHAFCQRVLKNEFQAVGIDPLCRVCDEQLRKALFAQALHDSMNELLEEGDSADFLCLMDAFNQSQLSAMAEQLYPFLMSLPDPFDWLRAQAERVTMEPWESHPWFLTLLKKVRLELQGLPSLLELQARMFSQPGAVSALHGTWEKDCETVNTLLQDAQGDAQSLTNALRGTAFVRAASATRLSETEKAWKDQYSDLRSDMKKIVKECAESLQFNQDKLYHDLAVIQGCVRGLLVLMERLHLVFGALKNAKKVLDFSDMEQMTLQILRMPDCRKRLQEDYDHLFVDECQDVSAVQDAMIQAIHGENSCLFMVGDVKQSIYRFRLADPTLFLHRMRTFSDDENAMERRIFLQRNFRSRVGVLDAANRVFRRAMRYGVTEIDYMPEDELIPGRETQNDPPVEIRLVDCPEESRHADDCLQGEVSVVVRRIRELLGETLEENGEKRFYQYRDMVILLQKRAGLGARLAELLTQQGIPVYYDGAEQYFSLPEIRTVKALLDVIDNPLQDLPLLATLRAHPFCLSSGDLADIRACRAGKGVPFYEAFDACCEGEGRLSEECRRIRKQLSDWRFEKECMRLSDFLWKLIRDTGFYAVCGAYPEGELRQANLRLLCQKAAEFESTQQGSLSAFLQLIDLQMQQNDTTGAKVLGENENLVRIMTMHKSKGLEFPVVFLMRLSSGMGGRNADMLKAHHDLGLCLPYVNRAMSIRRTGPGDTAFAFQKKLDEMAERCRLLYVAMTRARERLIITGCSEGEGERCWRMPPGDDRVWQAGSMLDWVMQAVFDDLGLSALPDEPLCGGPWLVAMEKLIPCGEPSAPERPAEIAAWARSAAAEPGGQVPAWWHEKREAQPQPLKTSVSSLTRMQLLGGVPEGDGDEEPEDKRRAEEIVSPLRLSELPSRPAFMEEKTLGGAERGTLIHRCLALFELERLRGLRETTMAGEVRAQLEAMVERGCLTVQELSVIRVKDVLAFYMSPLGQRLLRAQTVRREWNFNLRISRRYGTLLQGVMDCVFMEDGAWVLVDYKTDHIQDEAAFVLRHSRQLNWYARALREITGVPVKEMWLYSLSLGRAFAVSEEALPEAGM